MEGAAISAEVQFAQKLASNEKRIRDRAIKRLKKYLLARSNNGGLGEDDMVKIWKGLHYCMWMQDKPLLQEELCSRMCSLLQSFPSCEVALIFVKVFIQTEAREWNGIDKLRLDKFMMLIREVLRGALALLSSAGWPESECRQLSQGLTQSALAPKDERLPDGLKLHLSDIWVDEICNAGLDKMSSKKLVLLLQPFIDFIVHSSKIRLASRMLREVVCKTLDELSTLSKLSIPQPYAFDQLRLAAKRKKRKRIQKWKEMQAMKNRKEGDTGNDGEGEENENDEGEEVAEDEEMEEEEEEAEGGEDETGEEGEGMDVQEEESEEILEETPSFKMDPNLLLAVLFKLAQSPSVRAPNRAIVYKLVKKHAEVHDNIVNSLNSSTDESLAVEDEIGGRVRLADLDIFHAGGDVDQQQQQKKGRKKRKKNFDINTDHKENGGREVLSVKSEQPVEAVNQKKKKKKSKNKQSESKDSDTENISVQKSPIVSDGGDCGTSAKRKREQDEVDSPGKTPSKIRKVSPTSESQSPVTPASDAEPPKKKKKNRVKGVIGSGGDAGETDSNSNAGGKRELSPKKSVLNMLSSPVEVVVYPEKNPPPSPSKPTNCKQAGKKNRNSKAGGEVESPSRKSRAGKGADKQGSRRDSISGIEEGHLASTNVGEPAVMLEEWVNSEQTSPQPHSVYPSSSAHLAASLYASSLEESSKKKKGRKSRDTSPGVASSPPKFSEGSEVDPAQEGSSVDSTPVCRRSPPGERSGVVSAVGEATSAALSVFSSIRDRLVSSSASKVNAERSECSMDWSNGGAGPATPTSSTSEGNEQPLASDPGPTTKKGKGRNKAYERSLTPGEKKKVVFDLRKNRANKFTDYVRSLQRAPESPHLPERSPKFSILKPSPSPARRLGKGRAASSSPGKKRRKNSASVVRSRSNIQQS